MNIQIVPLLAVAKLNVNHNNGHRPYQPKARDNNAIPVYYVYVPLASYS